MISLKRKPVVIFHIALLGIRKWLTNFRMYVVFIMLAVFEWTLIQDIRAYAIDIGMSISCWYFPFLFVSNINCIFYYFALILMYCNAPYVEEHQMSLMLRSGRKQWFAGQILYTVMASFAFFVWMAVLSIIEYIPYVGFSTEWEGILMKLSQNPRAYGHGLYLNVPYEILQNYTPIQAFLLCFGINVGVGTLLGLLIFYVNLWKSRGYGAAVALAWVALSDIVVQKVGMRRWMIILAPTSWTNLSLYCERVSRISLGFVLVFLLSGIILLSVLIMIRSNKYSIEALEEI